MSLSARPHRLLTIKTSYAFPLQTFKITEFYILLTLSERELYAYEITQRVWHYSRTAVDLKPGTLYRSINTLLNQNLIDQENEPLHRLKGTENLQYYKLTREGRNRLLYELRRMKAALDFARKQRLI